MRHFSTVKRILYLTFYFFWKISKIFYRGFKKINARSDDRL